MDIPKNLVPNVTISKEALQLLDTNKDKKVTQPELNEGLKQDLVKFAAGKVLPKACPSVSLIADPPPDPQVFMRAVQYGEDSVVKAMIRGGMPVDQADAAGMTALMHAVVSGRTSTVKLLMASGAKAYRVDNEGKTPLMHAAANGRVAIAKALIPTSPLNQQDAKGNTALHSAAETGVTEVVKALIAAGADLNIKNNSGGSAFSGSVYGSHSGAALALIAAGADVNVHVDGAGMSLLEYVLTDYENGNRSAVFDAMLTAGVNVDVPDGDGRTLLHWNSYFSVSEAKALIVHGANVNAKDHSGMTPLHTAVNYPEVLKLLIDARADLTIKDNNGDTALTLATRTGHQPAIDLLRQAAADVNATDSDGRTELHRGSDFTAAEAKALIARGADINAKDKKGKTPLHEAVIECNPEVAQVLIDAGANLNVPDAKGETALMKTAYSSAPASILTTPDKHPNTVEARASLAATLIAAKADLNAKDKTGNTALMLAVNAGDMPVIKVLIAAKADLTAQNNAGDTALSLMTRAIQENSGDSPKATFIRQRYQKVVDVLKAAGAQ